MKLNPLEQMHMEKLEKLVRPILMEANDKLLALAHEHGPDLAAAASRDMLDMAAVVLALATYGISPGPRDRKRRDNHDIVINTSCQRLRDQVNKTLDEFSQTDSRRQARKASPSDRGDKASAPGSAPSG